MNEFITPQGTVFYEATGNGPEVVFLHSALADHRQWSAQVDALSQEYRCISYDLLGYGSSGKAPDNYDPADTLLLLLDHLDVSSATLVGSSRGGEVSIHAAIGYPDRIRSMVLVGTGLFGFQPELNVPEPSIYAEYEEALSHHNVDRLVELAEVIWLIGVTSHEQDVSRTSRESFRRMYRDFLTNHRDFPRYPDIDDISSLKNLDIPTMVIVGEHDTAFCLAVADHLERTLRRATIVPMPGTAHFPNLSKPQAVNELLCQWLKKIYE